MRRATDPHCLRARTNVPTLGAGAGWRGHLKKVKRTPETATARPRQFYCALKNTHDGLRIRPNEEMGNLLFTDFIFICLLANFHRKTDSDDDYYDGKI